MSCRSEETRNNLAEILILFRQEKGWTQTQLERTIGAPKGLIGCLECKSENKPSVINAVYLKRLEEIGLDLVKEVEGLRISYRTLPLVTMRRTPEYQPTLFDSIDDEKNNTIKRMQSELDRITSRIEELISIKNILEQNISFIKKL